MDGDISSKLNEILNDPQKMSAVMGIVSQMTGEKQPSEEKSEPSAAVKGLLTNSASDDKINLIRALKPFLDEKGREKADKLIKILGLYSLMNQIKL